VQEAERWAIGPPRACKLCSRDLGRGPLSTLAAHLTAAHAEEVAPADLAQFLEREAESGQHACALCGERVEHSGPALAAHMQQKHSLGLQQYYSQHIGRWWLQRLGWAVLGCAGLVLAGLCWDGMGWTLLGWDRMDWAGLGWAGLGWAGLGWAGMGLDGIGWYGMGWDGMGWDGMGWDGMGWDGMGRDV
jgi:hypothetical protein